MTELNKEQSKKADYILEILCNSDSAMGSEFAYELFDSENDAIYVCSILKKLNLFSVVAATERDPFYLISWNENTCAFLRQGGFSKKYNDAQQEGKVNEGQAQHTTTKINKFFSRFKNIWWQIIIPLVIGIILIILERLI